MDTAKLAYDNGNKQLAKELLEQILKADPSNLIAIGNLGKVSAELGLFSQAISCCQAILSVDPKNSRIMAHMAGVYAQFGEIHTAIEYLRKARDLNPEDNRNHSDLLITLHYAYLQEEAMYKEHLKFAEVFESPFLGKKLPLYGHKKPRIGYITHDVAEHAIWYILRAILPHHDRNIFDIYLYWTNPHYNAETDELRAMGDTWRTAENITNTELRNKILSDEIDVLIDLSGHTGGNVLPIFAERSAPIQMSWFGYMDTTGLSNMDYRITDRARIPETRRRFYTEKLLYLPDSYAFAPRKKISTPRKLPFQNNGYITFGSFNATKKINRPTIELWSTILRKIPSSKLVFVSEKSTEYWNKIQNQFSISGVSEDRIIFEGFRPIDQFLELAGTVDIALDPFPYTGGITTYHALTAGVPTITLLGTTEYERNSSAILESIGITDCTAKTHDDYVEKALLLSQNPRRLAEIRSVAPNLLGKDNRAVTHSLEEAILELV